MGEVNPDINSQNQGREEKCKDACDCKKKSKNSKAISASKSASAKSDTKSGSNTVEIDYRATSETWGHKVSHTTVSSGCLSLPLKSGDKLPLKHYCIPANRGYGTNHVAFYSDGWTPAGTAGYFSFLPYLTKDSGSNYYVRMNHSGAVSFAKDTTSGTITYFTPENPVPISAQYDSYTDLLTETNHETGEVTVFGAYASSLPGRPISSTDKNGNVLYYSYDDNALLTKITGDLTSVVPYFTYDSNNYVDSINLVDTTGVAEDRTIYFEYDSNGFMTSMISPAGTVLGHSYEQPTEDETPFRVTKEIDQEGYTTYFQYHSDTWGDMNRDLLVQTVEPESRVTYFDWDVSNYSSQKTLEGCSPTYYSYELTSTAEIPQLLAKRSPNGAVTQYEWDDGNRVTTMIDPLGCLSYFSYNDEGMPVAENREFDGATTYFEYADNGYDVVKKIGPRNEDGIFPVATYYEYDGNRNNTVITNAIGGQDKKSYDSYGRVTAHQDGRGNTTYYNYDEYGFLASKVDAAEQTTYMSYDGWGNRLSEISPRWEESPETNFTSYYAYDQLNRMVSSECPLGNCTYYEYTPRGDIAMKEDARGAMTYYRYNGLRLQTNRTVYDTDGNSVLVEEQQWSPHKNRTLFTDGRGNQTYYQYDDENQLICQGHLNSEGELENPTYFSYDMNGNQISVCDARGNTNASLYDEAGRNICSGEVTSIDNDTILLLHCDGHDGEQYIRDASLTKHNIVAYNGAQISTATSKFGRSSLYFDGSSYVSIPANDDLDFGADDFTIDFWFYDDGSDQNYPAMLSTYGGWSTGSFAVRYNNTGLDNQVSIHWNSVGTLSSTSTFDTQAWHHVAVVRSGTTLSLYVNGVQEGSVGLSESQTLNLGYGGYLYAGWGQWDSSSGYYLGYLDEIRISKGIARWTDEFTPPEQPYAIYSLNNITYYSYDKEDNRTSICNPLGETTYFAYDALNRQNGIRDALGYTTYFGYDAAGNRSHAVDALGHATYFAYDALNRNTAVINPLEHVNYYQYDAAGNITATIDALGNTTALLYDAADRQIAFQNALGDTTYYDYDEVGNRTHVTDALGQTTYFEYDVLNRQTATVDALGRKTQRVYDAAGNVVAAIDAMDNVSYFTYDVFNQMTAAMNANSDTTYFLYDPVGNRTSIQDSLENTSYFEYDRNNNLTAAVNALGERIEYTYDALNRRTASVDALGNTNYFVYDAVNHLTQVVDPLQRTSEFAYDGLGRLTDTTDAMSQSTSFAYDAVGNRTAMQDAEGNTTYYGYDALNRLTSITDAQDHSEYYAYDGISNLVQSTNAEGDTTYFAYDALGRQTGVTYPNDSAVGFGYDELSNLTSAQSEAGWTYFEYDNVNRLTKQSSPDGSTLEMSYSPIGLRTSLTNGVSTSYFEYDAVGRMKRVIDGSSEINAYGNQAYGTTLYGGSGNLAGASYDYDATHKLTSKIQANSAQTSYVYDGAGRLTGQHSLSQSGETLADFVYSYDAGSRIVRVERENDTAVYYTYDDADRLTGETWTENGTETYAFSYDYDAVGNRTYENNNGTETYFTYDAANEMTQAYNATDDSTTSYSYDAMGNCLSIADADGTTYFTYNDANLVKSITYPDSTANYFSYDALMRRDSIIDSTGTTYLQWDANGLNLLAERDASGSIVAEYTHGYSPVSGIGTMVAAKKVVNGTTYYQYPQYDHRGTVVGLTDKTGAVIASYEYNAFGEPLVAEESTDVQAAGNRFRYQSNWMTLGDSDDRFYISAARVYDAKLGRFLQRDPLPGVKVLKSLGRYENSFFAGELSKNNNAGDLNLYVYSSNSTSMKLDPYGLGWLEELITGIDNPTYDEVSAAKAGWVENLGKIPWTDMSLGKLLWTGDASANEEMVKAAVESEESQRYSDCYKKCFKDLHKKGYAEAMALLDILPSYFTHAGIPRSKVLELLGRGGGPAQSKSGLRALSMALNKLKLKANNPLRRFLQRSANQFKSRGTLGRALTIAAAAAAIAELTAAIYCEEKCRDNPCFDMEKDGVI